MFAADTLDLDPATYALVRPATPAAALDAFDTAVARGLAAMHASPDRDAVGVWRMTMPGGAVFERAREDAFRDLSLSHLVHHRGQFTVYLRLLDVPLAPTYGPTADTGR